jgi:hypothetical protein
MEGTDLRDLFGLGFWLSFYTSCTKVGTYGFTIEQVGSGVRYNGTFTINTASVYEYKSFFIPATALGTWVYTTSASMVVRFVATAGASNQATVANAWNSEGKPAAAGITNSMTATNDQLLIISPKLELGSSPTIWTAPTLQAELADCFRYLFVNTSPTMAYMHLASQFITMQTYPTPMRAIPTFSAVGVSAIAAAAPTANQIAFLIGGGYVTGLVYSSFALTLPGISQSGVTVVSGANATSGTVGQTGFMQVGSAVQMINSAEI